MGGFFHYLFAYWWVLLPAIVITIWAQAKVSSTYGKYRKVLSSKGITGATAAKTILSAFGLSHIPIEMIGGVMSDHYDPTRRVLRLSKETYQSQSVVAIGIAAHEVGHAIQHAKGYFPLSIRNTVYPVAAVGTNVGPFLIMIGVVFGMFKPLISVGIVLFTFAVIFSLITLPVEFDASARAVRVLGNSAMLSRGEVRGAKKVLDAAAMTYVAAALTSILTLVRLILLGRDE